MDSKRLNGSTSPIAQKNENAVFRLPNPFGNAAFAYCGVRITRLRISVMSSMAKRMPSLPKPLSLTPP